ncbi:hypothetical protein [Bradyrhizobium sp. 18]|uniref:hypothetical protein n=1 Tax=Bradyrhizobium sp. 18 TaxID=2782657 RepID=UPI001FF8D7A2|nr:hypothetical protein [Bradyrhizobium sp. 18]
MSVLHGGSPEVGPCGSSFGSKEIEEPRALAWARAENDKTLGVLQSDPCNRRFFEEALSMLQAKDRISYVSLERGIAAISEQDHVRGI